MCKPLFRSAIVQLDDEERDNNYEGPEEIVASAPLRMTMVHGAVPSAEDILRFGTPRARFGTFASDFARDIPLTPQLRLGLCAWRWWLKHELISFLLPILLHIDGAVPDQFSQLPVEPMLMTLGIFNRPAKHAWRTIGYDKNAA